MLIVGPLIAFGVIAGLAAVLRWAFDSDVAKVQERIFAAAGDEDYGLLSVASTAESAEDAAEAQRLLASVGIRATVAAAPGGRVHLLVFTSELEQARRVVGGSAL